MGQQQLKTPTDIWEIPRELGLVVQTTGLEKSWFLPLSGMPGLPVNQDRVGPLAKGGHAHHWNTQ